MIGELEIIDKVIEEIRLKELQNFILRNDKSARKLLAADLMKWHYSKEVREKYGSNRASNKNNSTIRRIKKINN